MCSASPGLSSLSSRSLAPQGPSEARPGLVLVPTSQKPFAVQAGADQVRDRVGGFIPAEHGRRLACLRCRIGFAARAHSQQRRGFRPDTVIMLTLTYRDGGDWRPGQVASLLDHIRHWCKERDIACHYVWVAELQKRGAIHYHLALWLPVGVDLPYADKQGWWPHGSTRTEVARAAVPYLMKYLSKGSDTLRLPAGARMYGVGGLSHSHRRAARWLRLPSFIQARSDIFDDWKRAPGGGWLDPTGGWLSSEFRRTWLGDAYGLMRVADHGRPFEAGGPFTWLHRQPQASSDAP